MATTVPASSDQPRASDATSKDHADQVRFSRPASLPGVELVSAAYRDRRFPVHAHAEYVVGAVTRGAESLNVEGRPHHAPAGSVLLLNPDQPHENASIGDETLEYHVLYIAPALVEAAGLVEPGGGPLRFETPVSADPRLFQTVCEAHLSLRGRDDPAEQGEALARLLAAIGRQTGRLRDEGRPARDERIARTKRFIDAHYAEEFGLADLTAVAGMSAFHLLRRFRGEVGLPPLAYRNQRRVAAARGLLLSGRSIAETALDVGFADQSHLTRHFQRVVGASPGRYRQQ
ncbi:MAG: AraC family transcriptional regulator [Caulobacteraceae bacterium]|nr:AraC family transcriptional regulator [Caulobacteraceae bacterium]